MKKLLKLFFVLTLIFVCVLAYILYAYHIVRDSNGYHLLAKDKPGFSTEVVDTRDWNALDWLKNAEISKGLAKLRWEDLRNKAEETLDQFRESVSETSESIDFESWSDQGREQWEIFSDAAAKKYDQLRKQMDDNGMDQATFDKKMKELRKWADHEISQLKKRFEGN